MKPLRIERHLSRFDLGKIKNIVDHRQQRIGRELDDVQALALVRRQLGIEYLLGHSQDAVHGRANFVTHIGQKFALGAIGGFGAVPGQHQFRSAGGDFLLEIVAIAKQRRVAKLDLREHGVEGVDELAQIVVGALFRADRIILLA